MTATPKLAATKPKLRLAPRTQQAQESSFMSSDDSIDISQLAGMASIFIWGLVLTKAKSGLEAADSSESGKVGGLLSKIMTMIVLIAVSALFKLVANITGSPSAATTFSQDV